MTETKYSRKLDSCGRLVIPIRLREKLHLEQGNVYNFYLHEDENGTYLCVKCPDTMSELANALDVLRKNGYEITEED